ncbi:MAG: tetratricopeptide repeat protein [Flavobacteriaceae bacterium]|nr:tetratricopeptide repeat protein [Flavobacteriaceae bacterium]
MNLKNIISGLVILLVSSTASAQQIDLKGQVSIHNSKYETGAIKYVQDAYVSAPFTKPANSDNEGKFNLSFVGLDGGTAVGLQVEKAGLEVVNGYDLEKVVINRKRPLRVFLTTKGKLAEAQTELYNISKRALFARKDAMIQRLRNEDEKAIAELEAYFGHPIKDRFEAETELIQRIENVEKRLPEFVQSMAQENLDFASDLYIKAFQQFKKGEIELAIDVLDSTLLNESYLEAVKSLEESRRLVQIGADLEAKALIQIDQIIESYQLKAESFELLFQYSKAAVVYEKLIDIYEDKENNLDEEYLAINYRRLAGIYMADGQYNKGLDFIKKALSIQEKLFGPDNLSLGVSYHLIANIYLKVADYQQALKYQRKAIIIRESKLDPQHAALADSYSQIGVIFGLLKEHEKAIAYHEKAMKIFEAKKGAEDPKLAIVYSSIAVDYQELANYEKAFEYLNKAIIIQKEVLVPNHPRIAISYNNMAMNWRLLGDYAKALEYMKKALEIQEEIIGANHPDTAMYLNNIGLTYRYLQDYQNALVYQERAMVVMQEFLPSKHPNLAVVYNNMGLIYRGLQEYQTAIDYNIKAIAIQEEILDPMHIDLAVSYLNIATVYQKMAAYQDALRYSEKAIAIQEVALDSKHPYVPIFQLRIASIYLDLNNLSRAEFYRDKAIAVISSIKPESRGDLKSRLERFNKKFNSIKQRD